MTQARKSRTRPVPPDSSGVVPVPAATSTGPLYISAEYIASLGLDPASCEQALADAQSVREQILASPLVDQSALVRWATKVWPTAQVDRLNAALILGARMGLFRQVG